jgi:hypothetical protein
LKPGLRTQRGELAANGRGCGTADRTFNVTWYSRMWSDTDRTGVPEDERGCFKSFISPPRAELFLDARQPTPGGEASQVVHHKILWCPVGETLDLA